jgi:hypothetical protein
MELTLTQICSAGWVYTSWKEEFNTVLRLRELAYANEEIERLRD